LTVSNTVLKATRLWFLRLKLKSDKLVSRFAFNFHLRRYSSARSSRPGSAAGKKKAASADPTKIGSLKDEVAKKDKKLDATKQFPTSKGKLRK